MNKNGFLMYLSVKCEVSKFQQESDQGCSFSLIFQDNPLNDFVELSEDLNELSYAKIICGVISGALNMVELNYLVAFRCKM